MMLCHPLSVLSTLSTVLLVAGFAAPLAPRWDRMRVKHTWNAVPEHWKKLGEPSTETTIDLHLALKSHRENALIDALYEVSDPKHPKYGAHLSKGQVAELVRPHPDTLQLVSSWLEHHGVPSSSVSTTLGGNWLLVIGVPVSQANDILGASYQLYRHVETNGTVLRTIGYSLPEALHGHVETVVPTTYFGSPLTEGMKQRTRPSAAVRARPKADSRERVTVLSSREPLKYVAPSYLRALYKTEGYVPAATDQNVLGIAGYVEQYPSPLDLTTFMEKYRTDGADATFTVEQVNGGGNDPGNPGGEANLNIQYAEAMAYPTPHIYYSTGGTPETEDDPYVKWLKYLLDQDSIPRTISTSYGGFEDELPLDYALHICKLFMQLGARGISVLFASGDSGVGREDCLVEDDSGGFSLQFQPIFPASCPWVTSVGGTTSHSPEVAASLSGGGFSNIFLRPIYQANAVPTFLRNFGDNYDGYYNPDGRGFPDISAQALNFLVILKGQVKATNGTSASAPVRHPFLPLWDSIFEHPADHQVETVAGVISLLNDYLISKGHDPLGFLNLWLYGGGLAGLNDITSGSNPGCGTEGFPAIVGWDPVTGLGTPDFEKLEKAIDDRLRNLGVSKTSTVGPLTTHTPSVDGPSYGL